MGEKELTSFVRSASMGSGACVSGPVHSNSCPYNNEMKIITCVPNAGDTVHDFVCLTAMAEPS
jgi:hypothetical protein